MNALFRRLKRPYFAHRGSFRAVLAYEWATRRAFTTRRALWRAWWWAFVRRYECEICSECGRPVRHVWTAPDPVWSSVMPGPGGVLCAPCFDVLYERKTGRSLRWVPRELTAPIPDLIAEYRKD